MDKFLVLLIFTTVLFFVIAGIVRSFTKSNKAIVYSLFVSIAITGGATIWSYFSEPLEIQPTQSFDCGDNEKGFNTLKIESWADFWEINANYAVLQYIYEEKQTVIAQLEQCPNLNMIRIVINDSGAEPERDRFGNVTEEVKPYIVEMAKGDFMVFMKYVSLNSVLQDFGSGIKIDGPYIYSDDSFRKGQKYSKLFVEA